MAIVLRRTKRASSTVSAHLGACSSAMRHRCGVRTSPTLELSPKQPLPVRCRASSSSSTAQSSNQRSCPGRERARWRARHRRTAAPAGWGPGRGVPIPSCPCGWAANCAGRSGSSGSAWPLNSRLKNCVTACGVPSAAKLCGPSRARNSVPVKLPSVFGNAISMKPRGGETCSACRSSVPARPAARSAPCSRARADSSRTLSRPAAARLARTAEPAPIRWRWWGSTRRRGRAGGRSERAAAQGDRARHCRLSVCLTWGWRSSSRSARLQAWRGDRKNHFVLVLAGAAALLGRRGVDHARASASVVSHWAEEQRARACECPRAVQRDHGNAALRRSLGRGPDALEQVSPQPRRASSNASKGRSRCRRCHGRARRARRRAAAAPASGHRRSARHRSGCSGGEHDVRQRQSQTMPRAVSRRTPAGRARALAMRSDSWQLAPGVLIGAHARTAGA